ncbi:MAG TPA: FtsX-like permease family protein [Thermomicrobiales bacterium]|nr:FtsX-like permease family protein [Thermomicrobiales bacterium]
MNNVFGLSMTTIMIVVLIIMGLCLLTSVLIAWRNPVIFRMAVRNLPRRKAQTVLVMIGLMLSTLIIAASLTTGDTLDYSIKRSTYEGLGEVDQSIAFVGDTGDEGDLSVSNVPIPVTFVDELEARLGDDPDIDGFMPMLTINVPVVNINARLNEPSVIMTGVDASRLDAFGGLRTPGGQEIDFANMPASVGTVPAAVVEQLGQFELEMGTEIAAVVISEDLADSVNAQVGDLMLFFYDNDPYVAQVWEIARGSILTGVAFGADTSRMLGMAVPLEWMQELTGLEGQARFIAVSNRGGVEDGTQLTGTVVPKLREALDAIPGGEQLGVNPVKQDAVEGAEQFGNVFMSFFLLFGLFSIAAGVLLIFLIFMMLAAERRSEMGMARAVGMKRRHLIQSFIAEGTAYDLGAALIGAALGVLVAFAIAAVLGQLVGEFVTISPHFTLRSLVVAYALGVTVTFLTIIFASVRSSRLTIAQAIRDLPEFSARQHLRPRLRWQPLRGVMIPFTLITNLLRVIALLFRWLFYLVGWGPITGIAGALFMWLGASSPSVFWFSLGLSLAVLGLSLLLRRWLPDRLVFTAGSGLMLLYWLLPFGWLDWILPELGTGGIEMFFLSGIFMVTFATLIIMWNAEVLVWLIGLIGRYFSRWMPAVKTAVAYPMASKGRTGMTVAMFSLVIFSLVTLTTINQNFVALLTTDEAGAGFDVQMVANPFNPVSDLRADLQGSGVDVNDIAAVGRVATIGFQNGQIRMQNSESGNWLQYPISGLDDEFQSSTDVPLQSRAQGYGSDADVWAALAADPTLAVVDSFAVDTGDSFGNDPNAFLMRGVEITDGVFEPVPVEIQNPRGGERQTITIIGVIDPKISILFGLYMDQQGFERIYSAPDVERIYVRLAEDATVTPEEMAVQLESTLLEKGVHVTSIREEIERQQAIFNGFLLLLQGFMGLGLFVGIAALGVISFRSVVERRQQIGMLRAIGYQRNMVAASFLLESLVIAGIGVLSGTIMAVILSYNLINSDDFSQGTEFGGFIVPWFTIVFFVAASLVAAAVMTWVPARKASSVPIAEALRYE